MIMSGYVVVQFSPLFKFCCLLIWSVVIYNNDLIMSLKQKQLNFIPRVKLNHTIYLIEKTLSL